MIEYVPHDRIDKVEWDQLNLNSKTCSIYNESSMLDAACPGWDGLIDRETGSILPLTHGKKWGVSYLYQPIGLQWCGGMQEPVQEQLISLVQAIPPHFRYWDFCIPLEVEIPDVEACTCTNQMLDLSASYGELRSGYSSNHRRNLRGDVRVETIGVVEFMDLFRQSAARFDLTKKDVQVVHAILQLADSRGWLSIPRITNTGCAAAIIQRNDKLVFFKSTNDKRGRDVKGMFHLIDMVIKDNSGGVKVLDFAGSNDPNTNRLYKGFGASAHVYLRIRRNKLPFPFNLLKK